MLHVTRIDSHFLIKITDVGLSEDIFIRNYFRQGTTGYVVKLPEKWMVLESLSDGLFSEKSDVVCEGKNKLYRTTYKEKLIRLKPISD